MATDLPTALLTALLASSIAILLCGELDSQSPVRIFHLDGSSPQDALGFSVSGAGDIDGDGFDDLILGAPGNGLYGNTAGAARVVSARGGAILLDLYGEDRWERFGASVSDAGDVDGDGIPDVIVGAPDSVANGYASVISGRLGTELHRWYGSAVGGRFGYAVSGAGDADGDGYADLVVGDPYDSSTGTYAGAVVVFSGRSGVALHTFHGELANDLFGWSVSDAGDVDGDGFDDVIAGALLADAGGLQSSGSARVFSGRTGALLHRFLGDRAGDHFSQSVGCAGDVDRDGHDDPIVGSSGAADRILDRGGIARVYSGRSGAVLFAHYGRYYTDSKLGESVHAAGDVDGDGFDDYVVGVTNGEYQWGRGRFHVYSGRDGATLATVDGTSVLGAFGRSVASAGDFDGDGLADIVVGIPSTGVSGAEAGAAEVYSLGYAATAARVRSHGRACPGSNGHLPQIDHVGRPSLDGEFRLDLRGALPSAAVTLNLGQAAQLGLDGVGLAGCTLYATVHHVAAGFLTDANGMASSGAIRVPNESALLGYAMSGQWVCLDAQANAAGLTLSNALRLIVGT